MQEKNNTTYKQDIYQGVNCRLGIGDELKSHGFDIIFLITGQHLITGDCLSFLHETNFNHYLKAGPNVMDQEIEIASARFQKTSSNCILAIGGGSVMDLGKGIVHRCKESKMNIPFLAVAPTTAGSGSEATQFAVVYKDRKKFSITDPDLLPRIVWLDPELTTSLTPYQTAVSGMDAFSQAIESIWSVHANEETRELAKQAMELWQQNFLNAVNNPDILARTAMMESANLAGRAIQITRTTGPHALSYYLTSFYGVPHGHAVALFLPLFFLYNSPSALLFDIMNVQDGKQAMEKIQYYMRTAGLVTTLGELDINKNIIADSLIAAVNEERFANNPEPFNPQKLKELIIQYL